MKLRINKISGYYEGPCGAFYDFKHDEIFVLEWNGGQVWKRDVGFIGRSYDLHEKSKTTYNTAITGLDNTIYMGEVGLPFRNK